MEHGPKVLIHPFYFMLRRLMMAIIVVIFRDFLWMQLFIKAMSIVAAVIIIGEADYFETQFKRRMEFANEILVMLMLYNMFSFSPFVPEIETRFKMGYFCCVVEAIALAGNLWLILSSSIKVMILKIRVWFAKRHKAKWRPQHLRKRAKGRVLRRRRNKARAKIIWDYGYEEEVEEKEDEKEIKQTVKNETKTKVKRHKSRFYSKSKSKKNNATQLDVINEEENESHSSSEESDMEEWAAKNNINLNELYGVNTRYEVAEVVNPEDELTPAEKRIRNR